VLHRGVERKSTFVPSHGAEDKKTPPLSTQPATFRKDRSFVSMTSIILKNRSFSKSTAHLMNDRPFCPLSTSAKFKDLRRFTKVVVIGIRVSIHCHEGESRAASRNRRHLTHFSGELPIVFLSRKGRVNFFHIPRRRALINNS
jgi:hypothetical protein